MNDVGLKTNEGVVVEQLRTELVEEWLRTVPGGSTLTAAQRGEVHAMALGLVVKDSAQAAGTSPETIRQRRKVIYRKLNLEGAHDVMQALLALTLNKLAGR